MCTRADSGFTLVELIVVIVLVGILGTLAVGRFAPASDFQMAGMTDVASGLLRYAQKAAIAQNRTVYVTVSSSRISLCFSAAANCAAADKVRTASGSSGSAATVAQCADDGWACEGITANITVATTGNLSQFGFDARGRPVQVNGNDLATVALTFSANGQSKAVTVESESGYVH